MYDCRKLMGVTPDTVNLLYKVSTLHSSQTEKGRPSRMEGVPATQLLYYDDAYLQRFRADVVHVASADALMGIMLNRTAFYPTGGGQRSDTGVMEAENWRADIMDVQWNRGRIRHLANNVTGEVRPGDHVDGAIDWTRRYALMKNHTAAHIMAEALRQALGTPAEIVSSGLDVDKARLDLAVDSSLRPLFPRIAALANEIVRTNHPVEVRMMNREAAKDYVAKFHESLATLPSTVSQVRIVEVRGVHACACGGTHVKTTGEIGTIEILGRSSKGKGVERLEFRAQNP
jgi:Ser-tRNA(Ala) deacylase AlaX